MTAGGETAWTLPPSVPLPLPGSLHTRSQWGPEWAEAGVGVPLGWQVHPSSLAAFSKVMTHRCLCGVFGLEEGKG